MSGWWEGSNPPSLSWLYPSSKTTIVTNINLSYSLVLLTHFLEIHNRYDLMDLMSVLLCKTVGKYQCHQSGTAEPRRTSVVGDQHRQGNHCTEMAQICRKQLDMLQTIGY